MVQGKERDMYHFEGGERKGCSFRTGLESKYATMKLIGKGGSAHVYKGIRKQDGHRVAIKKVPKYIVPIGMRNLSEEKQARHEDGIHTEVEVLLALKGSLSIVRLDEVYEDDKGGPLLKQGGLGKGQNKALSETGVSRWIRSVLQTVATCHARHIIHRDVKPENFLFLKNNPKSPLKAIDFGLAKYFTPESLPITARTAEGTPWYLAPEACKGKWWPATDVWACGVMAFYMLTGTYPFIDRQSPTMPDLAQTLKAICYDELDTSTEEWELLSDTAADFIRFILIKDPMKRPSALECLQHPWIVDGSNLDSSPPDPTVIQRMQRFSQNGIFKCSVLEHIGRELVSMHFDRNENKSRHAGAVFKERSIKAGKVYHEMKKGKEGAMNVSCSSKRFLPQASLYSSNLSRLLDTLETDADGKLDREHLHSSLVKIGHALDPEEVEDIFDVLDADRTGYIEKEDFAASLIDWGDFRDTFKDRWIDSLRKVFVSLDRDGDGNLSMEEIAMAFEGHLSEYEVEAAVHDVLIDVISRGANKKEVSTGESGGRMKMDFGVFVDFMSSDVPIKSSMFQNRDEFLDETEEQEEPRSHFSIFNCFC
eukprot:jgi/Picsp_1/4618/NSC_01988-R1_calcium-dependent protein kinase 34